MRENEVAKRVLDFCFAIHRELGPGLLESVYCEALALELEEAGLQYSREVHYPVHYKSRKLPIGFRTDFLIENCLMVEVKSIESLAPVHKKKVLTYLRISKVRLGLLVNFNVALLKNGIVRLANNLY